MKQRGRKSGAALAVAPSVDGAVALLPQRFQPPADLNAQQAARWREIVDDWPADRWRPSDLRMLADLVKTESMIATCDKIISGAGLTVETPNGVTMTHPAVTQRRQHIATVAMLQRTLRLAPSTRAQSTNATMMKRGTTKRPWEA